MLLETGEVKDWEITDPQKIYGLGDVYAIILDPSLADASGYIINEDDEQITVYLEKAPKGQNLYLNHTYLHLIVNTETMMRYIQKEMILQLMYILILLKSWVQVQCLN